MGWSLRCYIPSFVEIGPLFPEKKILKIFIIYGHGGHHGHVTWTIYTNFCYPFPMMLHVKFGLIGPAVSEEKMFELVDDADDEDNQAGRRIMGIL